jgi:hypothetical protein
MIFYFNNMELNIPDNLMKGDNTRHRDGSSQLGYVNSILYFNDIKHKLFALKFILGQIDVPIHTASDLLAGCGFTGKFLEKYLQCELVLNDKSQDCCSVLKQNFPSHIILNKDIREIEQEYYRELVLLDFNKLTSKHIYKWDAVFKKTVNSTLLITQDSACYGIKFGNMLHYHCDTIEEYYQKLDNIYQNEYGWNIHIISNFGRSALLLLKRERTMVIEYNKAKPMYISKNQKPLLY